MKVLQVTFLFLLILMISKSSYGQSPIITPSPGNYTVCPGEDKAYSVIPGPNYSNCGSFTWTITNGEFDFVNSSITTKVTSSATQQVHVFWKDVATTGTLSATSNCSEGALSANGSYAIRSLAGRTPANARAGQTLPYCSTASIDLFVDVMYLLNTGGTTGNKSAICKCLWIDIPNRHWITLVKTK